MKRKAIFERLRWSILAPIAEASAGVWTGILLILTAVQILLNVKKFGVFCIPVFLLYVLLLTAAYFLAENAKAKRIERVLMGDELYFQIYPRDRLRRERKLARQQRRERKTQHAATEALLP